MTAFIISLGIAIATTPLLILALRRWRLIDMPNHRSSHAGPVPRGGGIAIAVAVLVGVAATADSTRPLVSLVIGAVVLGATGFADDRWSLPAPPRLVIQLMTSVVIAGLMLGRLSPWVVIAAVVMAGYVNMFNFMDGINGISGSQAAIAGAFLALVADHVGAESLSIAGWAVCGASLGFLPYNAVNARVFLGDVGSYFLGFWLAALAVLIVDAGAPVVVAAGPFALYVLDTTSVLLRRLYRGDSITEAHREHAYQRLTQLGWSHVTVSVLCSAVAGVCAVIMFVVIDASLVVQVVSLAVSCMLVGGFLLLPDLVRRGSSNRAA